MSILDDAAANNSLANNYGPDKGAAAPASHVLALFTADGTEMDSVGGYARQTITNDATGWPDAPANRRITSAAVDFGTSTGEWTAGGVSAVATEGRLLGSDGVWYDTGLLSVPVDVSAAGATIAVTVTIAYEDVS